MNHSRIVDAGFHSLALVATSVSEWILQKPTSSRSSDRQRVVIPVRSLAIAATNLVVCGAAAPHVS